MYLYSNEIVFRGHPDKVCDQISDRILTECLKQDKNSRCGIETCGGKKKIFVTGEVTSNAKINVKDLVKEVLQDVGYDTEYEVIDNLGKQSADIALGTNDEIGGAGDNGMMFGYACNETDKFLPKAMVILQELSRKYNQLIKEDNRFLPDGKAQITGEYEEGSLKKIVAFTICYQNTELNREETDKILKDIAFKICNKYGVCVDKFYINPTGKFLIGGFEGDAGLTGRKIVVDTYHSFAPVGGGAFSGKDPTKVDRSAAYKARQIAIRVLKEKDLSWCRVQLSYAIGIDIPLAIYIESDKGVIEPDKELYFECTPKRIIADLDLKNTDYLATSMYGHFGIDAKWESN